MRKRMKPYPRDSSPDQPTAPKRLPIVSLLLHEAVSVKFYRRDPSRYPRRFSN